MNVNLCKLCSEWLYHGEEKLIHYNTCYGYDIDNLFSKIVNLFSGIIFKIFKSNHEWLLDLESSGMKKEANSEFTCTGKINGVCYNHLINVILIASAKIWF